MEGVAGAEGAVIGSPEEATEAGVAEVTMETTAVKVAASVSAAAEEAEVVAVTEE